MKNKPRRHVYILLFRRRRGIGIKTYHVVIVHTGSCNRFTSLTGPDGEFGTTGYSYSINEKCQWKIELDGSQVILRTVEITPITKHTLLINAVHISTRTRTYWVQCESVINAKFAIWPTADAQRPY